jgi:hypothetical protein
MTASFAIHRRAKFHTRAALLRICTKRGDVILSQLRSGCPYARALSQYLLIAQSCHAVSCCTCTLSSLSQIAFVKAHHGYNAVLELRHDCFPTLTPRAPTFSFFLFFVILFCFNFVSYSVRSHVSFFFASVVFLAACAHMCSAS